MTFFIFKLRRIQQNRKNKLWKYYVYVYLETHSVVFFLLDKIEFFRLGIRVSNYMLCKLFFPQYKNRQKGKSTRHWNKASLSIIKSDLWFILDIYAHYEY